MCVRTEVPLSTDMDDRSATTVIEALASSLEAASRHNPGDVEKPAAIVWTDHDSQWQPIIPQLRQLVPQLLTLGEYQPEQRTGPAIWLRCAVDHTLEEPKLPEGTTPILYLPGISRQALRAVQECPDSLKPLVELQYRGVCWTQKKRQGLDRQGIPCGRRWRARPGCSP